jgi:hypothetical protein
MLAMEAHRPLRLIFGPPEKAPPMLRSSAATLPSVAGFSRCAEDYSRQRRRCRFCRMFALRSAGIVAIRCRISRAREDFCVRGAIAVFAAFAARRVPATLPFVAEIRASRRIFVAASLPADSHSALSRKTK